jgi:hypothetical protein
MSAQFQRRMAALDALVAKCKGKEPFVSAVVRDASNRSNRDWQWWSVEIEQQNVDSADNRRATAIITLTSTQSGEPASYKAEWRAQTWRSTGGAALSKSGALEVPWTKPTADLLLMMADKLLAEAKAVMPTWKEAEFR